MRAVLITFLNFDVSVKSGSVLSCLPNIWRFETAVTSASDRKVEPTAVEEMLDILELEVLERNLFRGRSPKTGWQRVFGGQVIGQALVAAQRTVPVDEERPRFVHSLHGYFLRPGDPSVPIIYEVDRIRDGSSFTTRRVVGIQHGHAIFSSSVSFHIQEDGFDYSMPMEPQTRPEDLINDPGRQAEFEAKAPDNVKADMTRQRPIEM
ncbi:unnamed protein product, partial [Cyprideis torosa]